MLEVSELLYNVINYAHPPANVSPAKRALFSFRVIFIFCVVACFCSTKPAFHWRIQKTSLFFFFFFFWGGGGGGTSIKLTTYIGVTEIGVTSFYFPFSRGQN